MSRMGGMGDWPAKELKAGIQRTLTFFRSLEKNMEAKLENAAAIAATAIYNRSQIYVPVDEGIGQPPGYIPPHPGLLKESGRVEIRSEGMYCSAFVIYGSAQAFYAVYVHERPATHAAPTSWKYLEKGVQESTTRLGQIFKKYLGTKTPEFEIEGLEELQTDSGPSGTLHYGHGGGYGPVHTRVFGP